MHIFMCSSEESLPFCQSLAQALRHAGATVLYDDQHRDGDALPPKIKEKIRDCQVYLLILSPATLASSWALHASKWAHALYRSKPTRLLISVMTTPISELTKWDFLDEFRQIEAPSQSPHIAIYHTLFFLALASPSDVPTLVLPPQPSSLEVALSQGQALLHQHKYREALPLLLQATHSAPLTFVAWFNLGYAFAGLHQYQQSLEAYEQALTIDPFSGDAWISKGLALSHLQQYKAALAAYEQALILDPTESRAWASKGLALHKLDQYDNALVAYEHALSLTADAPRTWRNMARALQALGRDDEAQAAYANVNGPRHIP